MVTVGITASMRSDMTDEACETMLRCTRTFAKANGLGCREIGPDIDGTIWYEVDPRVDAFTIGWLAALGFDDSGRLYHGRCKDCGMAMHVVPEGHDQVCDKCLFGG